MKPIVLIGAALLALSLGGCASVSPGQVASAIDIGFSLAKDGSCLLSAQAGGLGTGAARICMDLGSAPVAPIVVVPAK